MPVREQEPPVVPLGAASGPENPPCPACGEPMFAWVAAPWGTGERILRCERCGLAANGSAGGEADVRNELERQILEAGAMRVANRNSFAAWMGGGAWAPLGPSARYLLTADALGRLYPDDTAPGWRQSAGIAHMWQTLLNTFTFGRNLALGRMGRLEPAPAARPWQRGVDVAITIVTALPLLGAAALMEAAATLAGRGGALRLR